MTETDETASRAEARRAKLTKRAVDAASPEEERYVLWDTEVRGFGLRVYPSEQKTYLLKHKGIWHTIGQHGSPWTPDTARDKAKAMLRDLEQGVDLRAKKQAADAMPTMAEFCDTYLTECVNHKKPKTINADRGRIEHHIKPLIGKLKMDKVTADDVARLWRDVKAGKTAGVKTGAKKKGRIVVKGGAGAANQCVMLLSAVMSEACDPQKSCKLRTDNPCEGFKKPKGKTMMRFLDADETARLGAALKAEVATSGDPYGAALIALLAFTGMRRGEAETLEWRFVDFPRRALQLPDSKTGWKIVYLNSPALVLLEELTSFAGDARYVFQGYVKGKHFQGLGKVWNRVRKASGLEDVRLHDLRHSFASASAAGGSNLPMIGALLGHKHAATTQKYVHLVNAPVHEASEKTGTSLATAMGGTNGAILPFTLQRNGALPKRA
jgi:integrase